MTRAGAAHRVHDAFSAACEAPAIMTPVRRTLLSLLLSLPLLGAVGTAALAQGVPPAPGEARSLSLDEAAALVRDQVGGRVVRAETRDDGGLRTYVFRVVSDDGRVRTVSVDAATGALR
jgi:hypothetical protein